MGSWDWPTPGVLPGAETHWQGPRGAHSGWHEPRCTCTEHVQGGGGEQGSGTPKAFTLPTVLAGEGDYEALGFKIQRKRNTCTQVCMCVACT